MDFQFSPEIEAFRREVKAFLDTETPPEFTGLSLTPADGEEAYAHEVAFRRKLGQQGWLAIDWPRAHGGGGKSFLFKYVLAWEMKYRGAPYPLTAVDIVAPVLIQHGSARQRQEFLPRIARGEIDFALGYTEPDAGTDLASLATRAIREGGSYRINGQKVFTSFSHRRDYIWLAARTRDSEQRHRGISLFIVDARSPGVSILPMWTMDGECVPQSSYRDVTVPLQNLVGQENEGWRYLTTALGLERLVVYPAAQLHRVLNELRGLARHSRRARRATGGHTVVRHQLAELAVEVQVATLLSHRAASAIDRGTFRVEHAAMVKAFNADVFQRAAAFAMRLGGLYCQVMGRSPWAILDGRLERLYRASMMVTFGAGSNEIQRTIIATQGLGLPRSP